MIPTSESHPAAGAGGLDGSPIPLQVRDTRSSVHRLIALPLYHLDPLHASNRTDPPSGIGYRPWLTDPRRGGETSRGPGQPQPPTHHPNFRKTFLRKMKFAKEARNWRPIFGTQTLFWRLIPPRGGGGVAAKQWPVQVVIEVEPVALRVHCTCTAQTACTVHRK